MTIATLIAALESREIILFLADDEIRYRSPKNALSEADKGQLRARRGEILDYLRTRNVAKALRGAGARTGPLTISVAQEMWWAFAGGPQQGIPAPLNIAMVDKFNHDAPAVTAAIHAVIARYDTLRSRFQMRDNVLQALLLNPADAFVVEQVDLRHLSPERAAEAAWKDAQDFCAQVNLITGEWLTRARVFALPGGESLGAISSLHIVADAGTRNIVIDEIRDILDHGGPRAAPAAAYNDYGLAERDFLAGPQGEQLIAYWRRWYHDQPVVKAPSGGPDLLWGNGIRIVRNFTMPGHVADKIRLRAEACKVTPFLIFMTIFSIAMARWLKQERFLVSVLGDKRTSLELSNMVGLMFCADVVEIDAPASADFETIMRSIQAEYDAALALRIPTLHYWAPHCVRPGIEAPDYPNKIPAVFNYYSMGTVRERAEKKAGPDVTAALPWPPEIVTLPPQQWTRRSAPLFLHVNDTGQEVPMSLHFYQGVVSPADQESFTAQLFQVFAETIPA
jgi:hypothetical protein